MKNKKSKFNRKSQSPLAKLSLFQKNDIRYSKRCPFSKKNAETIDYKNTKLLKKYLTENQKSLLYHKVVKGNWLLKLRKQKF